MKRRYEQAEGHFNQIRDTVELYSEGNDRWCSSMGRGRKVNQNVAGLLFLKLQLEWTCKATKSSQLFLLLSHERVSTTLDQMHLHA
mmetsp:Transcript_38009/g.98130  ORF Transcript_38009/g.98130 Transcript_38009/m.98130 type:complete len:86 (+) Transcript_38009:755-1012(+)